MLLPLIIFATGYNMRRKKFFENIANVAKFGLLGTLLTFLFYTGMTFLLFHFFKFKSFVPNHSDLEPEAFDLDIN